MPVNRTNPKRNKRYEFDITPEQYGRIELLAAYWEVSKPEVLRHILDQELQQYVDAIHEDARALREKASD